MVVALGAAAPRLGADRAGGRVVPGPSRGRQAGVGRLYAELAAVGGDASVGQTAGDVRKALASAGLADDSPHGPQALNVVPWAGLASRCRRSSEELKDPRRVEEILGIPGATRCRRPASG